MAHIREEQLASGWRGVYLENGAASVLILPDKGSEIFELRSKPHNVDVLWKSPWGLRKPISATGPAASPETAWLDAYGGGWQELFPNGGNACVYRGAELGFHGEASVSAWHDRKETSRSGEAMLHLALNLARSPFSMEKTITLDAERPVLTIWERIVNNGVERMPYMWGHHPAYGAPFLAEGCELSIPARTFRAEQQQTVGHTWMSPGVTSRWPMAPKPNGSETNLRYIPGPEAKVANMGYVTDLEAGWYSLTNRKLGLGVGLTWQLDVFPVVWLWQELCGSRDHPWYGRSYVMGVEPHTSALGRGLVQAIEHGVAKWLEPGQAVEMTMRAVLFEPKDEVRHITPSGEIHTK